jgi:hypothetical protein
LFIKSDLSCFVKKALNNNYKVCGYFFENELVAFSSAIEHDGEYDMNYIGFDYALNNQLHLYFNILFHWFCFTIKWVYTCH